MLMGIEIGNVLAAIITNLDCISIRNIGRLAGDRGWNEGCLGVWINLFSISLWDQAEVNFSSYIYIIYFYNFFFLQYVFYAINYNICLLYELSYFLINCMASYPKKKCQTN